MIQIFPPNFFIHKKIIELKNIFMFENFDTLNMGFEHSWNTQASDVTYKLDSGVIENFNSSKSKVDTDNQSFPVELRI